MRYATPGTNEPVAESWRRNWQQITVHDPRPCSGPVARHNIWIGINKLRGILPRFSFRVPECERGLEALFAYHTVRETSTGIARDEPCHDASSHACDALRLLAEAEAAHMLSSAGSTPNIHRQPVTVRTGFRGNSRDDSSGSDILDGFFGPSRPHVRVLR